jgi:hypothetical protein
MVLIRVGGGRVAVNQEGEPSCQYLDGTAWEAATAGGR